MFLQRRDLHIHEIFTRYIFSKELKEHIFTHSSALRRTHMNSSSAGKYSNILRKIYEKFCSPVFFQPADRDPSTDRGKEFMEAQLMTLQLCMY